MITVDRDKIKQRLVQRLLKYKDKKIGIDISKEQIKEDIVDELVQINKETMPFVTIYLDPDLFDHLYNNILSIVNNE